YESFDSIVSTTCRFNTSSSTTIIRVQPILSSSALDPFFAMIVLLSLKSVEAEVSSLAVDNSVMMYDFAVGKVNVNVDPSPKEEVTFNFPPCSSTSLLLIFNPNPKPLSVSCLLSVPCVYGSKICRIVFSFIPTPVTLIDTNTRLPSVCASMIILPAAVYLTAL